MSANAEEARDSKWRMSGISLRWKIVSLQTGPGASAGELQKLFDFQAEQVVEFSTRDEAEMQFCLNHSASVEGAPSAQYHYLLASSKC